MVEHRSRMDPARPVPAPRRMAVALVALLALVPALPGVAAYAGTFLHNGAGTAGLEVSPDATLISMEALTPTGPAAQWAIPLTGAASPMDAWGVCGKTPAGAIVQALACLCPAARCVGWDAVVQSSTGAGSVPFVVEHQGAVLKVRHTVTAMAAPHGTQVEMLVEVTNTGATGLEDVEFRRGVAAPWRIWGTTAAAPMLLSVASPHTAATLTPWLRYSGTAGLVDPLPAAPFDAEAGGTAGTCPHTAGPGALSGGPFYSRLTGTVSGCKSGHMVELALGDLDAGATASFRILLGTATSATSAYAAAVSAGADLVFMGEDPTTAPIGDTFTWALTEPTVTAGSGPLPVGTTGAAPKADTDADGVADDADNCPSLPNAQSDWDFDGIGDACDLDAPAAPASAPLDLRVAPPADHDRDGVSDPADLCPRTPDPLQADLDRDGNGDACDPDWDGDGIAQAPTAGFPDNCPRVANPTQEDADGDGAGDACLAAAADGLPERPAFQARSRDLLVPAESPAWPLAAAAAAFAGLAAALATHRRWLPALAGFTRIQRDDLLEHPGRLALAEAIDGEPGLPTSELARRTGTSRTAAEHHLRLLAKAGLVLPRKGPAGTGWFPAAAPREAPLGPAARRLAGLVAEHPGASVGDLARLAGLTYGAAHYHLRRLAQAGRLDLRESDGLAAYPVAA